MLFDSDILIWVQRGNPKAARLIERTSERFISAQSYMELLQCAQDKAQHRIIRGFLKEFAFSVLPFSENIGHRAMIYVEEFGLSNGMRAGDAIIAASAVEHNLELSTANVRHFKPVKELQLRPFKP